MKNLLDTLKTVAKKGKNAVIVGGTLLALGGLAGKVGAQTTTFSGIVWRGSYGTPADSCNVTLYNPRGPDSTSTKVGRLGPAYWARGATWGLQIGDTVKIKFKDTNGDTAKTYRIVTSPSGGNPVQDMYPAGQAIDVLRAIDSVDSANAKCWVEGKLDTLYGRFRVNTTDNAISFNANNFPARSRPNLNDLVDIIAWEGSVRGSTQGRFKREFWDADTLPSFNLTSGVYEEIDKHDRFVDDLRITPNPFTSFATLPGHEAERFSLYDVSGRKVGIFRGDRVGEGLAPGVYFLRSSDNQDKPLRVVKVR